MNKLLVFSKELLEWAQSLPNVVIPAGLESDVQEAIAETEAAQQSAQTDGLCLYPGCDDIGWNGGFCRLHNPANTPPAKSDPS